MNYKEQLLKEAIGEQLKDREIHSLLVFTNSNIRINNLYKYVEYTFLRQLSHIIDEFTGADIYSELEMDNMVKKIDETQSHKEYPIEIDMRGFVQNFAKLLATLELGESLEDLDHIDSSSEQQNEPDITCDNANEIMGFLDNVTGKIAYALVGAVVGVACAWGIIRR